MLEISGTLKPLLLPLTRVEADLSALARNIRRIRGLCRETVTCMAVVKADGYGHGALRTAQTALESGAGFLGVARISEAAQLRRAGIEAPILLLGDIRPEQAVWAAQQNIRITLFNPDTARAVSRAVCAAGLALDVHVKIDTGMGRLGFTAGIDPAGAVDEIRAVFALENIRVEGLYTHFANADASDPAHAQEQLVVFTRVAEALANQGLAPRFIHAANSAAAIALPQSRFNMIRPGIAMYGLWPSPEMDRGLIRLEPVLSVKSEIIQLKNVPKGFKISYGSTHITDRPTCIATIPIGYADGYSRLLSNKGVMLVRGRRAPVAGRICMDFTMIDVGHIPGVKPGDEVVIIGSQGKETVSADELASLTRTINYEIVAGLTGRMPICYTKDNERDTWR